MDRMSGYSQNTRQVVEQIRQEKQQLQAKCGALVAWNDITTSSTPNTKQLQAQVTS